MALLASGSSSDRTGQAAIGGAERGAHRYQRIVLPADIDSELAHAQQPGEPAALTLARAVVASLLDQAWVTHVGVESGGAWAAVSVTAAIAGVRVISTMTWRAARFLLTVDGEPDPLNHSGLARQAEHLATLVTDTAPATVERLAHQQVAERLAGTILYLTRFVAGERTGNDADRMRHQCAVCAEFDVDAACGRPARHVGHRCPVCRGEIPPPAPPVPQLRPRRRRRIRPPQGELFSAAELAASSATEAPAVVGVGQARQPQPSWRLHQILLEITDGRYTWWRGDVYRVVIDHAGASAQPLDAQTAALMGQLRAAHMVESMSYLWAGVDGHDLLQETRTAWLNKRGRRLRDRWARFVPLRTSNEPTSGSERG